MSLLFFYYWLEHTFVINKTLFAHVLTTTFHLSLGGLFGMVYEHLSRCFIFEDPSLRFSKLFQVVDVVAHGDILRLMALLLGVKKLLAMVKDT
jgi:hypothetical protein